jgi:large subunit ribosomal protein L17
MRHNVKGRKLGRTSEHRQSMFRNQLASLMASGRIVTTLPKAKELRPLAERLVTKGKRGSVDARRQVRRWIAQRELIKKLFDEVAPRFAQRDGGYLRILKLGPRPGDGAEMAILQWVDYELEESGAKAGKDEKPGKGDKGQDEKPAKAAKAKSAKPAAERAPRGKRGGKEQGPSAEPAKKRPAGRKAPSGG